MEDISKNSVEEGKLAALGGGVFGAIVGAMESPMASMVGLTLGSALGAFLQTDKKNHQKEIQSLANKSTERDKKRKEQIAAGKKYSVYMNGKHIKGVDLDGEMPQDALKPINQNGKIIWVPYPPENLLTAKEAVESIHDAASREHDINTYFSIKDEILDKVVWRFKITDIPKSADELPKIDEDYKQLARIVELSKK